METVTLSPKFQVVIPKTIRERMGLQPGEKLQAISFDNRIEIIPIRPMSEMKVFLKGCICAQSYVIVGDERVGNF